MTFAEDISDLHCPACRSNKNLALGIKHYHLLRRCTSCRTLFVAALEAKAEVQELYEHYYDRARFDLPPAAASSLTQLVKACNHYRSTGRWADIGYGEGGLLRIVEECGWRCYGTELSPQALDFGCARGWTVSSDADNDERFPAGGFDVVSMIEFIEHALAPEQILSSAARLLRPGGLLYLTTPNAGSINRRLLGLDWSVISPPEHLTIWSASGLCAALRRAGLHVRRVRAEGLNPGEVWQRLRKRAELDAPAPSRNDIAFALNQKMTASPSRRLLKRSINQVLSGLGIGDSLKIWAVKDSLKA